MSWEARKKKLIKWYYGSFVNDPYNEVIMFGSVRPYRAMQLDSYVRFLIKHGKLTLVVVVLLLVGLIALAVF